MVTAMVAISASQASAVPLPGWARPLLLGAGIAAVLGCWVTWARAATGRSGRVAIEGGRLVVGEHEVPLRGARLRLASWQIPHVWLNQGTVALVDQGRAALAIAGRDHALGEAPSASPTYRIDATLEAGDFADFLRELRSMLPPPPAAAPGAAAMEIMLHPSTARAGLRSMMPWLQTIAAMCVLGPVLGIYSQRVPSPFASGAVAVVLVAMVATGLYRTVRAATRRPPPSFRMTLADGWITLLGGTTGAVLERDPASEVRRERKLYSAGRAAIRFPMVKLRFRSGRTLSIGALDDRFGWPLKVRRSWWTPRYAVGGPDWEALVDALQLRSDTPDAPISSVWQRHSPY